MNRKLLSLAVAAGIAGAGGSALAVDFTSATPDAATIATEQTIGATGMLVNGALVTATFAAGFSIDDTNVSYIRFGISGGSFGGAQSAATITTSNAGGITATYSQGGATTDDYVIYSVVGTANDIAPTDTITTDLGAGVTVTGAPVTLSYALYETASDAVNETNALSTSSGTLIDFAAANNTAADAVTTPAIDVTTTTGTGAVFVGGNPALIGAVNTTDTASVFTNATGVAANTAAIEASANLTITGDFTFTQDLVAGVPNGTYAAASVYASDGLGATLCTNVNTAATSVNATTAVIPISGAGVNYICAAGNGVSLIAEQTFTASYDSVANAGFGDESTALTLGTLTKNGASDSQELVLTPGGVFKNYLRVVNTSNLSGEVTFQLIADDGTSVTGVSLGSISGQSASTLAGQNSTSLIDIDDLYAAAQAADATFDVQGGKLRVTATGNFSTIELQNISLSTDNTTFGTF